jgi:hypothetical protein
LSYVPVAAQATGPSPLIVLHLRRDLSPHAILLGSCGCQIALFQALSAGKSLKRRH